MLPDVSDLSAFKSLRPSDRELLTEEIYRTNLYQVVYDMRNRLVGGESRVSSRSKLPPRSVKSSRRSAASRRTTVSKRPAPITEAPVELRTSEPTIPPPAHRVKSCPG